MQKFVKSATYLTLIFLFLQPSYWAPSLMKSNKIHNQPIMSTKNQNESYFEPDSSVGVAGMDVKNLNKVFKSLTGDPVQAVNSVSFKAYEGQITALLGHNGAGKSTTMNVLTGEYIDLTNSQYV